jgi:hypothetical protein
VLKRKEVSNLWLPKHGDDGEDCDDGDGRYPSMKERRMSKGKIQWMPPCGLDKSTAQVVGHHRVDVFFLGDGDVDVLQL